MTQTEQNNSTCVLDDAHGDDDREEEKYFIQRNTQLPLVAAGTDDNPAVVDVYQIPGTSFEYFRIYLRPKFNTIDDFFTTWKRTSSYEFDKDVDVLDTVFQNDPVLSQFHERRSYSYNVYRYIYPESGLKGVLEAIQDFHPKSEK